MSDSHAEVQPPAKKRRAANFSEEELMLLIEEVAERKAVLLGPLTSVVINKGKELAWKAVAEVINSVGVVQRNVSDIKKKWFKVKSEVKCKAAKEKIERSKTDRPQPSTSAVYRQPTGTLVTPVEHISPQPQSNEPQPSTSSVRPRPVVAIREPAVPSTSRGSQELDLLHHSGEYSEASQSLRAEFIDVEGQSSNHHLTP
ncbi:hypothetical protein Pcinc_005199 [Petrolisthes cinctipes]|uniref:Regulatory protein zeste n=1 Tax=Petrolisthes cinctipes TaxID=88211 RepID=A0AAE1GFG1_PETCI|nr:hypothetical protein Pcinc_005199 [Petrolisthes cinctipes]